MNHQQNYEGPTWAANPLMSRQERKRIAKANGTPLVKGIQDDLPRDERGKIIPQLKQISLEFTRKSVKGVEYKYTRSIIVGKKK